MCAATTFCITALLWFSTAIPPPLAPAVLYSTIPAMLIVPVLFTNRPSALVYCASVSSMGTSGPGSSPLSLISPFSIFQASTRRQDSSTRLTGSVPVCSPSSTNARDCSVTVPFSTCSDAVRVRASHLYSAPEPLHLIFAV